MKVKSKAEFRVRRHLRLRNKVQGSSERPRMSVFASNKHLYVQFIDDVNSVTMASASTMAAENLAKVTVETARELGKLSAQAAKAKGISKVVFDRGGFAFGARLKALADAARSEGLEF